MGAKLPVLLLLLLPLLVGCWDKVEIEEGAYALAIGVGAGESSRYKVTVTIAKPDQIAGKDGKGEGKPFILSTVEAPSLSSALSTLNAYTGRQVNLSHARALFIDEELARSEGLRILDELLRFRQARQSIFFIVTREPADQFLAEINPLLDKNPMKYIEELTYHYRRNGMLPASSQVNSVASQTNVNYAQPVTYYASLTGAEGKEKGGSTSSQGESPFKAGDLPRKGGANVEMVGAAAFRGERMIGVLDGKEMRLMLMLQDEFRNALVSFKDPREDGAFVSVKLNRSRPLRLQVDLSGSKPRITGTISLEAEVLAIQSGVDYSEPELQVVLERAMAQQVREPLGELIAKTQRWESDVIGFGRRVVPKFATIEAWERYDWPKRFPEAEIKIDVQVSLRRFGLTLSPTEPHQGGK